MKSAVSVVCVLGLYLALSPALASATNPYDKLIGRLANNSFERWSKSAAASSAAMQTNSGIAVKSSGGTRAMSQAKQEARQNYLAELVPSMGLPSKVAHIPKEHPVSVDSSQRWTKFYGMAKNRLRPEVEYSWSSNATGNSDSITLSKEHVQVLRENFDIVMWYRQELEQQARDEQQDADSDEQQDEDSGDQQDEASKRQNLGALYFKTVLDHIIADLLRDLPETPEINMTDGSVRAAQWKLDEQKLREQLVMTYRYLKAKYQVYPQYEQFAPADQLLMSSLVKIGTLMGARLNPQMFDEMDVDLKGNSRRSNWKKPLVQAFSLLKARAEQSFSLDDDSLAQQVSAETLGPSIVEIPKPKPKKKKKKDDKKKRKGSDNPKVEIIVRQED